MKNVELSLRLKSIANMVCPGTVVYDVGCDHGFLSIYLVSENIADSAVALDVVEGPLKAAKEHVFQYGLNEKIECRLSDGLHKITTKELESLKHKTLIIAGMGGPLIVSILTARPEIRDLFDEIIVGPQSKIEEFRVGISKLGLDISDENMVFEDGKYYQLIKLTKVGNVSEQSYAGLKNSETEYRAKNKYGKILLSSKNKVLLQYLEYEYGVLSQVKQSLNIETHSDRYKEVCDEIEVNRYAYNEIIDNKEG